MSAIEAKQLRKRYGSGDTAVDAVREMSFVVESGEFVAVMGESGSGKSTLLSMLGALNSPTDGSLTVDEIEIYSLGQDQRADFRREYLGFVFQSFHMVPYLTVAENVMLPLATVKVKKKEKRRMALEALSRVGLEGKADRLPSEVSGGEQERVAIARAIVNEPPILLADEPTGKLDSKTSSEVMELLRELNNAGMTVVMVTHSEECALSARRVLRVADGCIVEEDRRMREASAEAAVAARSEP